MLSSGEVAGLVVTAGPGMGRTTFGIHVASLTGRTVREIAADRASTSLQYGAIAPLVATPQLPLGDGPDALTRAVDRLVGTTASVLVADDAEHLDASSSLALARATDHGVLVVLGRGRGTSLPSPLAALDRRGLLAHVELGPIDDSAVARLVSDLLDGPVEPVVTRELLRSVGGAPAAIVDVVRAACEDGTLARIGRVWRQTGDFRLPSTTLTRVAAVTADLRPSELDALDIVVLAGSVPADVLRDLAGTEPVETLDALGLLDHGVGDERGRIRCADPLVRSARSTSIVRSRAARLADALRARVGHLEDPLLASTLALVLDEHPDPATALAAARAARAAGDIPLAARLCRAALAQTPDTDTAILLAEILIALGRTHEAESLLTSIRPTDDGHRALVAMTRVVNLAHRQGEVDAAFAVIDEVVTTFDRSNWADELVGLRAVLELLLGRPAEALATVEPLLSPTEGRPFVEAATAAGPALVMLGRHLEAAEVAGAAFDERVRLGDQPVLSAAGLHALVRSLALTEAGTFEEAAYIQDIAADQSVRLGDRDGQMWAGIMAGRRLLHEGELDRARTAFETAASAATDLNLVPHLRWARAGAVLATAQSGDLDAVHRSMDALDACPPTVMALMSSEVDRARAWARIAAGDLREGAQILIRAADTAADGGQAGLELLALHDLIRVARADQVDRLVRVASAVQGPFAQVRSDHGAALAAEDAEGLTDVADRFEQLGASLLAAEAANHASWAHRRNANRAAAERERARVLRLRGALPAVATPALELHPGAAWLTAREREIAALAAAGVPSKQIAARLEVSVRTVDNLLQRVYRKLGIRGRDELRDTQPTG